MATPRVITQVSTVAEAKEVRLLCPHCYDALYVTLDWAPGGYATEVNRDKKRKAIEEHRKLCSAAPPEAGRVYEIAYPRK